MPISALSRVGFAKETTWGTGVAATKWFPATSLKAQDDLKYFLDQGKKGIPAKDFGAYAGTKLGSVEYGFDFFADTSPNWIMGIMGQDTVTGTTNYTHTFALANTTPSYSFSDYNGINERQYAGAKITELSLKWNTETGVVAGSVKATSKASTVVTTTTPTFGTIPPFMGWNSAISIGGTGVLGRMLAGEIGLKRSLKPVFGANSTQDPSAMYHNELEVTGKLTFDMPDDNELMHYLTNDQPATTVTFTQGASSLKIQLTKCMYEKATPDRSQEFVRIDAQIRGIYNATDAGPCQIVVINTQSQAY